MSNKNVITVTEFMNQLKGVLDDTPFFRNVSIVGEVSNFTAHRSGHFYFSIKDDTSIMKAVMFRSSSSKVLFKPKNGDRVVVSGSLSVYTQSGDVQFYATRMSLDGLGDLYLQFELLKKTLFEKGYFDESLKKPLPKFPKRIGVITGEGSAAHADITRTLNERWPYGTQIDYFAYVQGIQAIDDLALKIARASNENLDVIILARGGGSLEDLWAFNDIKVVMAVLESNTPIVAGIGHESDVTLVDYVADYRAATPTAAAVIATPSIDQVFSDIRDFKNYMYQNVVKALKHHRNDLDTFLNSKSILYPETLLDTHYYRLDLQNSKLLSNTKVFDKVERTLHITNAKNEERLLMRLGNELLKLNYNEENSMQKINYKVRFNKDILKRQTHSVMDLIGRDVLLKKTAFSAILKSMQHLSPFSILDRGYSIMTHGNKVVKSVLEVEEGMEVTVTLKDGTIRAKVEEGKRNHD